MDFPDDGDDAAVTKTGTTTVGVTTDDGVVIATDKRASVGGAMVSHKNVQKVEQIHPRAAITLVGSVSAAQSLVRSLEAEIRLYEARRGEDMDMEALSTLTSNLMGSGAFFVVNPILGGVDDDGPHVYGIDPLGSVIEDDYVATGSGTQFALGVLEQEYDDDLSMDEAVGVAARAVGSAIERDLGSGNGIWIAEITAEGVEISDYDAVDDVLAASAQ